MPNGPIPTDPAAQQIVDILAPLKPADQARALREVMDHLGVEVRPNSQRGLGSTGLKPKPPRR